jgi:mannose-6-phosphate isomerase
MEEKNEDRIEKPWGWERILELNAEYCIKHLFVKNECRLSEQYHVYKTETLILIDGSAELMRREGDQERVVEMPLGQPFPIPPGLIHRIRGSSPSGALILEVSTPELSDVVRLSDDYGREGK